MVLSPTGLSSDQSNPVEHSPNGFNVSIPSSLHKKEQGLLQSTGQWLKMHNNLQQNGCPNQSNYGHTAYGVCLLQDPTARFQNGFCILHDNAEQWSASPGCSSRTWLWGILYVGGGSNQWILNPHVDSSEDYSRQHSWLPANPAVPSKCKHTTFCASTWKHGPNAVFHRFGVQCTSPVCGCCLFAV